jgi:hypothetical protein
VLGKRDLKGSGNETNSVKRAWLTKHRRIIPLSRKTTLHLVNLWLVPFRPADVEVLLPTSLPTASSYVRERKLLIMP